MPDILINLSLERQILASLLLYENLFFELDGTDEEDFSHPFHKSIYYTIRDSRIKKEKIDHVILGQKLFLLGLSKFEEVDTIDYCQSIIYNKFESTDTAKQGAKELFKLKILRKLYNNNDDIQNFIVKNLHRELSEIITEVDGIYNKVNKLWTSQKDEPVDLYGGLNTYLDTLGNSLHNNGVECPFPIFRDLYGDFYPKSLNFIVARAKVGKSSILENICWESVTNPKQKVKALILDTEMSSDMVRNRRLSNLSGVNEWFIRTGKFKNNQKMYESVNKAVNTLQKYSGLISYMAVGNADISFIAALIRRWVSRNWSSSKEKDNTQLLVVYDYIKLSDELGSQKYSRYRDYQIVGQKVDILKQLANSLDIPIITAGQTNRMNEERVDKNKKIRSGAVVGLSDQINQLSDKVLLLDRLTTDELIEVQQNYGIAPSHSLQSLYCRSLGVHGAEREQVRVFNEYSNKFYYSDNRIFYKVNNFKMQELSSLWDLEAQRLHKINLNKNTGTESELSL